MASSSISSSSSYQVVPTAEHARAAEVPIKSKSRFIVRNKWSLLIIVSVLILGGIGLSLFAPEVPSDDGGDSIAGPEDPSGTVIVNKASDGKTIVDADASMLQEQCPNWPPAFTQRYREECGYWIGRFAQWEQQTTKNSKEVGYWCENNDECRGWGDRLGGILNAFYKALQLNWQFRIFHEEGVHSLFQPCVFKSRLANWAANTRAKPKTDACIFTSATTCFRWMDVTCPGSTIVTKNTDRTCVPASTCNQLVDSLNPAQVQAANAVGCALRAVLEPSKKLFKDMTFPFKVGRGKHKQMSLGEIQQAMSSFYVISIHFRLGDAFAFFNRAGEITLEKEKYSRPFRCADTLESFLGKDGKVNGKRVMWFLASDSFKLKLMAEEMFGDKLITLDIRPQHVALAGRSDDAFARTVAEWYVLGLGDQLVVNRIGTEHGNFYRGRISAFPKTSWAYHLKHSVYDAGRCIKMSLPFEGIWDDLKQKSCATKSIHHRRPLDLSVQPHLNPLEERNLTFPLAYVSQGKVVVTTEASVDDGTGQEPDEDKP